MHTGISFLLRILSLLESDSKRSNAMEYKSNGFHYVPDGTRERPRLEL